MDIKHLFGTLLNLPEATEKLIQISFSEDAILAFSFQNVKSRRLPDDSLSMQKLGSAQKLKVEAAKNYPSKYDPTHMMVSKFLLIFLIEPLREKTKRETCFHNSKVQGES